MRESILAREEVEKLARQIDWDRARSTLRPPQAWFDDDDNPFEPEEPGPSAAALPATDGDAGA